MGLPVITQKKKGFEANRTRKFTRTFGKIFVIQFLCGTFSVPNWNPGQTYDLAGISRRKSYQDVLDPLRCLKSLCKRNLCSFLDRNVSCVEPYVSALWQRLDHPVSNEYLQAITQFHMSLHSSAQTRCTFGNDIWLCHSWSKGSCAPLRIHGIFPLCMVYLLGFELEGLSTKRRQT